MTDAVIYHNPRCSKSRQTLALLQEHGIEPQVVKYLEEPPDLNTLKRLRRQLGVQTEQMVRRNEDAYKTHIKGKELAPDAVLEVVAAHPKLLQRPIVVIGDRAAIGRPPEQVLDLL